MVGATTISQALAVPFRRRRGRLEFCLITSLGKGKWIFPKGIVEPGDTPQDAALKEAHEEAGLRGQIRGRLLGRYVDHKWGSKLLVSGYLMEVSRAERAWDEAGRRRRRWCTAEQARHRLGDKPFRRLLEAAVSRLKANCVRSAHADVPSLPRGRARSGKAPTRQCS